MGPADDHHDRGEYDDFLQVSFGAGRTGGTKGIERITAPLPEGGGAFLILRES